ncbi:MAG TPA: hypothetical protein ENG03_03230 [Thioploca sp.]|nr:MAG: hypothetical protein DRR19_32710 [Gammaproteobacteria bacterium]HDN26106.1 hypothetical protein [Thioploca sp.]
MILFIYKATEDAPFEGLFYPIGDYKKIILSNNNNEIERFNQHNGSPITDLLPEGIADPTDETICCIPPDDNSLFFIPLEMKETFMKLLEGLFKKTTWLPDKTTQKPSKDEIGLVGGNEQSQFYDNLETQSVLKPAEDTVDKTEAKQGLLKLFNDITHQDNEIDAVLVSTYDSNRTRVAYSSEAKEQRAVDTDSYAVQLKDLVSLLSKTKQVNPEIGLFDHVMFQYQPEGSSAGGIIHVTHLPQYGEYTFLIFVSATSDGIEMLELYRKRNIEKIKEFLDLLIGS